MNSPMKFVSLDAIAQTLGVYVGDASKFLKCCNVIHIPADRVPNENCTGATVKGWSVDHIVELLDRAVTGFSDEQEDYLRSRATRCWRDIKRGCGN